MRYSYQDLFDMLNKKCCMMYKHEWLAQGKYLQDMRMKQHMMSQLNKIH